MSNVYARASDTFVRREVLELRALGHTVHTFSIRSPDPAELVSDAVRSEHARTDYVLAHGPRTLAAAAARWARRDPHAFARAARLAGRVATPGARGRLWPYAYLLEASYLAERLVELGVEHLHNHIAEGSAAVAMLASELSGVPFSVTVHGPGEFDRAERLALDVKLEHAAFFATISDFARGQLMRWTRPEDWDRIHIVRCGVERGLLERTPAPPPAEPRFVSIGRLDVQKGQLLLLEAVARVPGVELTLIGDGPLRGDVERAVERLGLADRVRLTGWLGAEEVLACVERSRGLVMASLAEGLPVVVMEALALGRPAIATDVAATGELVETGATGWLVPAGAVEPLAEALAEAAGAPADQLARLGAAGAARVRERHDAAAEAGRLARLFEDAAR